jgi:hypothetical protein
MTVMYDTLRCDSYEGWDLHDVFHNSDEEKGKNKAKGMQRSLLRSDQTEVISYIRLKLLQ